MMGRKSEQEVRSSTAPRAAQGAPIPTASCRKGSPGDPHVLCGSHHHWVLLSQESAAPQGGTDQGNKLLKVSSNGDSAPPGYSNRLRYPKHKPCN